MLKMYIIPIPTYTGSTWAPFISNAQWRQLEVVQTIGTRMILGIPTYVKNEITLSTTNLKNSKQPSNFKPPHFPSKTNIQDYTTSES
jgi:hypothetical protein